MNFSNKLDILTFFKTIKTKYCIIKISPDFPNYFSYSDIDIFCYDIKSFINELILFFEKELNEGWKINFNEISNYHVQADFYPPFSNKNSKLEIRFDLYSKLPKWKHIKVKDSFFVHCLENTIRKENDIFIPSLIDDCILRYIEFTEYYDIRADKIKHAEFIIDKLTDDDLKNKFFNTLYYFTEIPEDICLEEEIITNKISKSFIKNLIKRIKN